MQTAPDEQEDPTQPEEQDAPNGGDMSQGEPDGGNPDQMIGYIPAQYSTKLKTYLTAAKAVVLNPKTAALLKQMMAGGNDLAMTIATFVGKTVDALETKLGPLTPDEHDQVSLVIVGWLVSSLQKMGAPGLDDQGGRHDLIGRIMQALDQLTGSGQGQGDPSQQPQGDPSQGRPPQQDPSQAPPLSQFGGQ